MDKDDPGDGPAPSDSGMGVGPSRIVLVTNQRVQLLDHSGAIKAEFTIDDPDFPLRTSDPIDPMTMEVIPTEFFDPQTGYDQIHDRLWFMFTERGSPPGAGNQMIPRFSLAITRAGVTPNGFSENEWWFYTGPAGTPGVPPTGNGGHAFDLASGAITPATLRFGYWVDRPTLTFDSSYLFFTGFSATTYVAPAPHDSEYDQRIAAIPLVTDPGPPAMGILDGVRPSEALFEILLLDDLVAPVLPTDDASLFHFVATEPFQQIDGAAFLLATPMPPEYGPASDFQFLYEQQKVRIGAVYVEPGTGDIKYRFANLPIAGATYFNAQAAGPAETPSATWGPGPKLSWFHSATVATDTLNRTLLFAIQQIVPRVEGEGPGEPSTPSDPYTIQWYVIDPDPTNITGAWNPTLEVVQRLSIPEDDEAFHPTIGVNQQGVAYIAYTYSSPTIWPQLRQARLSADYMTPTLIHTLTGPSHGLDPSHSWADYTTMQPKPNSCGFVIHEILVAQAGATDPTHPPGSCPAGDCRAAWLSFINLGCNNGDMNANGLVDTEDVLLFNNFMSGGDLRADVDISGTLDLTDAFLFNEEYMRRR